MPSIPDALLDYKWIILFYLAVFLIIYFNRKKFEIHFKVFALYKSRWGIRLMDQLGSRFSSPIKILGYAGIVLGFAGMAFVVGSVFYALYALFFIPNAPASVAPVLPGVKIPGTTFFIPFWEGIIAIFIVAVVHEFGHGVIARAHKVEIKSTGPFVMGPFFGAFVEPDENSLKKKKSLVQLSIFSAGPCFNLLLALACLGLINLAFAPIANSYFQPSGVSALKIAPGSPAEASGLQSGVVYSELNGRQIADVDDFVDAVSRTKPGDKLSISSRDKSYDVVAAPNPNNASSPYIGVVGLETRHRNDKSLLFAPFVFIVKLFWFIFVLSIAIGTANLLPLGPIDGGRMILLVINRVFGEEQGKAIWARMSIVFLFFIILLMTPIFKAVFESIFGKFA